MRETRNTKTTDEIYIRFKHFILFFKHTGKAFGLTLRFTGISYDLLSVTELIGSQLHK
jgi:hypothetical protein